MKFARLASRCGSLALPVTLKTGITDMPLERRVCPRAAERRQAITLFSSRQTTVRRRKSQQIRVLQKEARE